MKGPRIAPPKHDWLYKTHRIEVPSWTTDTCIAYLALSECTQIKLPGGGTAAQSKELVDDRLKKLLGKPHEKAEHRQAIVDIPIAITDYTLIVHGYNMLQCLIDRAFPVFKVPRVINAHAPEDKLHRDVLSLKENSLFLIHTMQHYNSVNRNVAFAIEQKPVTTP